MTPQQAAALDGITTHARDLRATLPTSPAWLVSIDANAQALREALTPPPPEQPPEIHTRQVVDRSRVLCVPQWYAGGGLYSRLQDLLQWEGNTATLTIRRKDMISNSKAHINADYTPARTYSVLVGGQRRAFAAFVVGQSDATLRFDISDLPAGWYHIDLDGLQDGETWIDWFAYRHVPGAETPALMPVVQGSHGFASDAGAMHRWAWVPTRYTPTPAPLADAPVVPVSQMDPKIRGRLLASTDEGQDVTLPNVNSRGVWSTFSKQAYFFADVIERGAPTFPLIDGPRGVGTVGMVVHLDMATVAPGRTVESYHMTPWSWRKVMRDGEVKTLAGLVHDKVGSHWRDGIKGRTLRLVGDWSAIPAERRGYWDPWGTAWLQVAIDEAAAPIPAEGNLKPHLLPPIGLVADSGHNRILAHRFSADQHAPEPVVTEWMPPGSVRGAFGLANWGSEVIVGEREGHRIVAIDPATRLITRVIVQRNPDWPGNASMGLYRRMQADGSRLTDLQAQPCLGPETLRVWGDWLYYSSYVAQCIKRVHLVTGEVQMVTPVAMDRQSWFVQFDVCRDSSFAPAGTVFYASWGQAASAMHYGVMPGGMRFTVHGRQAPWDGPQMYPASVAVGDGRMIVGGSAMGLTRFENGTPIDPGRYARGKAEFVARGGRLRYGPGGFSPYGHALPWGQHADLDYYLQTHDLPRAP